MDRATDVEERYDRAHERKEPVLFVVDEAGQVVYEAEKQPFDQLVDFCPKPGVLRTDLRAIVRTLVEATSDGRADQNTGRFAFVAPGHFLRLRRLVGPGQPLYALTLEPFRNRDTVRVAARRFSLTKREHEILVLILEGANAPEIADALRLSEHTVQGYFKRLLKKTNSRNRASMVASVLEWKRAVKKQKNASPALTDAAEPKDA